MAPGDSTEEHAAGQPVHVAMLRAVRNRQGWSQDDLARALMVSRSTIARWEAGHQEPPPYLTHTLKSLLTEEM